MSSRERTLAFGSCAALVAAGALCAVFVDGTTGQILAVTIMVLALAEAVLLSFIEVGLSAARERALEQAELTKSRPPDPEEYEDDEVEDWHEEVGVLPPLPPEIGVRPHG